MNTSNVTNNSSNFGKLVDWTAIQYAERTIYSVTVIVGSCLNLWMLLAVLTSRELRSKLRNKLLCSVLAIQLLDTLCFLPGYLVFKYIHKRDSFQDACQFRLFLYSVTLTEDFISNWNILLLEIVFLAQVTDFNISEKLSSFSRRHFPNANNVPTIATVVFLITPWLVGVFVVSIVTSLQGALYKGCLFHTLIGIQNLLIVSCPTPMVIAAILLGASAYLRHRRIPGKGSVTMSVELIGRGPEVDLVLPHAILLAAAICFDIPYMAYFWRISGMKSR